VNVNVFKSLTNKIVRYALKLIKSKEPNQCFLPKATKYRYKFI